MIEELAADIWECGAFRKEYERLIAFDLGHSLGMKTESGPVEMEAVRRLIQTATIFASTTNWTYREAAYRIGVAVHEALPEVVDGSLVELIFARLGNFPGRSLLNRDGERTPFGRLPAPLWLELASREEKNTVPATGGDNLVLTDFQRSLWSELESGTPIAVSAPTSAGKSFLLQQYILSQSVRHEDYVAVYVVPTRALINQVSSSLAWQAKKRGDKDLLVVQVPAPPSELRSKRIVYVLTQERLQLLSEAEQEIRFNLLVVDESQVVAESSRGIILQTVVERLLAGRRQPHVMFAAPLSTNPEVFRSVFDLHNLKAINVDESPVTQNLILLDVDSIRPKRVSVSAVLGEQTLSLGEKELNTELYDDVSTLARLAWEFGRYGKNLVYAGGQAVCEDIAGMIADLNDEPVAEDSEIEEFIGFLKEYIHPQYLLASTLTRGVAFHYGHMPTIVRRTIEELFDRGKIRYLVCTSTLLHGVNLPAKNMFMLKPTKGRVRATHEDIPVSPTEFWNLAGRAGRLGRDFQGNVFLINLENWLVNPLRGEKKQQIRPSLARQLSENAEELIRFISDEGHKSGQEQGLENAFVKLFNAFRRGNLDQLLSRSELALSEATRHGIVEALSQATQKVSVPPVILEQHIDVSPYRQQEMLNYIFRKIRDDKLRDCIPPHPLAPGKSSYEMLLRLFKRISTHFEGRPSNDDSHKRFAFLAMRWMKGEPLARIIEDTYKFEVGRRRRPPLINTLIRNIMENIEEDLRFRYVKFTACYIDLLKHALEASGNQKQMESIPPIPLFLEMGASSMTMLSLMGLGLSRPTAGFLSSKTSDKNMNMQTTIDWLRRGNVYLFDIPEFYLKEIRQVMSL